MTVKIAADVTELIANTPLVRLAKISKGLSAEIVAKLESFNPCSSVKDRTGLSMIVAAEEAGKIGPDTTVVEATSGNTGIVVGETCRIGKRVRIYQGVTLGAKSFPLDKNGNPIKGIDRRPIVEDDVIIYSGATILGRVTIGSGSVIGGNVWLTHSVPPGSRITQQQASQESFDGGAGI